MKHQLWLVWDDGENPRMVMSDREPDFENYSPVDSIHQISLAQLVGMLDEELENANRHDFVGMAGMLSNFIDFASDASSRRQCSHVAKTVLWMVACRGGFEELAN